MKQEGCKRLELKQNGMQVILEFPRNSEQEEKIKREVKEILSGILREYLIKNSIGMITVDSFPMHLWLLGQFFLL